MLYSSHNKKTMQERRLLPIARTLSIMFTPFYLPIVSMIAMFFFSYLSILPWQYKLQVIVETYLFTILIPTLLIHLYRRYHGWSFFHLRARERRMVPYIISILSYFAWYYIMRWMHMPHFMSSIIVAALFVQIVCALTNVWFKVSAHMAAIGGVTGGIIAFSLIFGFNAVWWLAFVLILSGMVGTSRMMLRVHTLSQIVTGYLLGAITTFLVIILI